MRMDDEHGFNKKGRVTVYFSDCTKGLGMKICSHNDENGNHLGIFVKQILPDSVVAKSGKVFVGDRILHCNGYSFDDIDQIEAVSFLRLSAQTGSVLLVLDQTEQAHQTFNSLPEAKTVPQQNISAEVTPVLSRKHDVLQRRKDSVGSSISSNYEKESWYESVAHTSNAISPKQRTSYYSNGSLDAELAGLNFTPPPSTDSGFRGSSQFVSPGSTSNLGFHQNQVVTVVVDHTTSLGIGVTGGTNREDGPHIYISAIIPGGDVHEHGDINVGDILVSIDGESFVGITYEQSKSNLTRLKLKKGVRYHTIAYIPRSKQFIENEPTLDKDYNNVHNSIRNPQTSKKYSTLPKVPNNTQKSPRNIKTMSLSELRLEPIRTGFNRQSASDIGRPTHGYEMVLSPNIADDPMLNELLDLMEDIQDSEVGSILDNDVFVRGKNGEELISPLLRPRKSVKTSEVSVPQNTISHYLNQDVKEHSQKKMRRSENCSLDPSTCIKLEKLEMALNNLGVHPTIAERNTIRDNVTVNSKGEVLYGEFVAVAKEVLGFSELHDHSQTLKRDSKFDVTKEIQNLSSREMSTLHQRDDLNRMRRDRDDALREVQYFRSSLYDKDRSCLSLQDQLDRCKEELAESKNECNMLRRQTRQESHRRVKTSEREQAISILEKEVATLRSKQAPDQDEFEDIQKRLVVLGCQLRKSEVSKRTYEVAVDKLTRYVENLHVTMESEIKKTDANSENTRKNKKLHKLSNEAKDVVKTVKMLLEEEPLPFGWEEVYSEDGGRYYMNHVTQTTSWIHPVSGVQHTKSKKDNKK